MLDNNLFTSLAFLPNVMHVFPNLKALSLQGNQVSSIGLLSHLGSDREAISFPQLSSLNLSHNLIADYSFIDGLPQLFPGLTSPAPSPARRGSPLVIVRRDEGRFP